MKKLLLGLIFAALVFAPWPHSSAAECPGVRFPLIPISGFEQLTVSTVAVGLTVPLGATSAVATLEGGAIRYRDDGTNPTSSVGTLINSNGTVMICGENTLNAVMFIRDAGTDGNLNVNYYGG